MGSAPYQRNLRLQTQLAIIEQAEVDSVANTELTISVDAPGEGLALVIQSLRAFYDDNSEHEVELTFTPRNGIGNTVTVRTGGSRSIPFLPPVDGGLICEENTGFDVVAEAGGTNVIATVRVTWSIIETRLVDPVLQF